MAIKRRDIIKFFRRTVLIAVVIMFYVLGFRKFFKTYVVPAMMDFVWMNSELLMYTMWFVFILCSFLLIIILNWMAWEYKRHRPKFEKYFSKLVARDYYTEIQKRDTYRAIRTYLNKYRGGQFDEDEERASAPAGNHVPIDEESDFDFENRNAASEYELSKGIEQYAREMADKSNGVHYTYHRNNRIKEEFTLLDERLHGIYKKYYSDGKIRQVKHFRGGLLDGTFSAYDIFGIPFFEIEYKSGKFHGEERIYDGRGVIQHKNTYLNGKIINSKVYDETGALKTNYNFRGDG
jgi:hypothetical protein